MALSPRSNALLPASGVAVFLCAVFFLGRLAVWQSPALRLQQVASRRFTDMSTHTGRPYNQPLKSVPTRLPMIIMMASSMAAIIAVVALAGRFGYLVGALLLGGGAVASLEVGHKLQQRKRKDYYAAADEHQQLSLPLSRGKRRKR
jgi:hypothetical protein